MERNDRLESNPLRRVGKVECKGHEKVKRRSFTNEEMRRLLAAAGLYSLGYLAAVNTGLRRKELASVQWGDLHLEADRPYEAPFRSNSVISSFAASNSWNLGGRLGLNSVITFLMRLGSNVVIRWKLWVKDWL